MSPTSHRSSLAGRTTVVVAVVALALAAGLLIWEAFSLVLLVFAGILLAVFLDGLTGQITRRAPLPRSAALAIVVILLLALLGLAVRYLGPPLTEQLSNLVERVPRVAADLEAWLGRREWGRFLLERLPSDGGGGAMPSDVFGRITGVFSSSLSLLTNILVVLFLGFYVAVRPDRYRDALLRLLPAERRARGREVASEVAQALRSWLTGRAASMLVVALLTGIGLAILGVPLVFSLALLAGALSFVPYIGPIVAAVPAIMVAWMEDPGTALWVMGLYAAVQLVESYVITPLIQQHVVSMAPALLIFSQLLLGVAGGVLGVLVATPLAVAVVVLIQTLYVEDVLGEDVQIMGQ